MPEEHDPEKGYIPQDQDAPILHPGVSTEEDGEEPPIASDHSPDSSSHSEHTTDTIVPVPASNAVEVTKTRSRATSVQSHMSVVPRSKRRGLLGRFTIIPEVENPQEYGRRTKWLITFLVALAAVAAPMGSAIFYRKLMMMLRAWNIHYPAYYAFVSYI